MEVFLSKLGESILSNDWIILMFAIFNVICFLVSLRFSKTIAKELEMQSDHAFKMLTYNLLSVSYTLLITITSLFPLLGMLGTVKALIELDLSQDLEVIKVNFFNALTSTAWGIIFSAFFKLGIAFIQTEIEMRLDQAKILIQESHLKSSNKKEGESH